MPKDIDPLKTLNRLLRISEKLIDLSIEKSMRQTLIHASTQAPPVPDFLVDSDFLNTVSQVPNSSDPITTEMVIGRDDRIRVTNVLEKPFCWVCQMLSSAPGKKVKTAGSGILIGPKTILTAGHNLYVDSARANYFQLYLGCNGNRSTALWKLQATRSVHHPEYKVNSTSQFDIAIITLEQPVEAQYFDYYGAMPIMQINPAEWVGRSALVTGYPKDDPNRDPRNARGFPTPSLGVQAFQYYCKSSLNYNKGLFNYSLDTTPGQSGSPLVCVAEINGQRSSTCIGVHIQGDVAENRSVPLSGTIFDWLSSQITGSSQLT